MRPDHSKPCKEGQRALGLMLPFILGHFGDQSAALSAPHTVTQSQEMAAATPVTSRLDVVIAYITFHYPRGEDRLSFRRSALVREELWEGQPWGKVQNVQGETHHAPSRRPLSRRQVRGAQGLWPAPVLYSQRRLGLGRHRTLAPENEGQEACLSLQRALIGGLDPGITFLLRPGSQWPCVQRGLQGEWASVHVLSGVLGNRTPWGHQVGWPGWGA